MIYNYKGYLKADIPFHEDEAIKIEIVDDFTFILPVSKQSNNREFEFKGKIEADNEKAAVEEAKKKVLLLAKTIGIEINVGIYDIEVAYAIPDDGKIHLVGVARMSGSAYITRSISNPKKVNNDIKRYIEIITKLDENSQSRILSLMNLLFDAIATNDNVRKFWYLYTFLDIRFTDRAQIDNYLKQNHPEIALLTSDYGQVKGWRDPTVTKIVAIRDSFSHRSTYNNGVDLDLHEEVNNIVPQMLEIVRNLFRLEIIDLN